MKKNFEESTEVPLDIVGSSTFGRDPKIMSSRTFNMIESDGWLINYFGYQKALSIADEGNGRGLFASVRNNLLITVIDDKVYSVTVFSSYYDVNNVIKNSYSYTLIGLMDTSSGDVFIDENNTGQIAICDQFDIYIYNHSTGVFKKATLPTSFTAGYVTYQDGRFIAPDTKSSRWALSQVGDGLNWFWGPSSTSVEGSIQTKPDLGKATLRFSGRGNLLFVMGKTVTELWTDVGSPTFPYQRNTSVNIDYGCINAATIASLDNIVVWLGSNEKSGPVIMYSTGSDVEQISSDGINYNFSNINFPEKSTAFFVKLNGHLIYQLTFYDSSDNCSLIYDFTTKKFFDVTDENMNYHIVRRVSFFEGKYYFISINDGNLYVLDYDNNLYDYGTFQDGTLKQYEIPKIRICSNIRTPNSMRFCINNVTFTVRQGNDTYNSAQNPSSIPNFISYWKDQNNEYWLDQDGNNWILTDDNTQTLDANTNYYPKISLSISKDGGISFGPLMDKHIYKVGRSINRLNWWNLGSANDLVMQFRFSSKSAVNVTDGMVTLYQ